MNIKNRHFTLADRLCLGVDQAIRTLANQPRSTGKPNPAGQHEEASLSPEERAASAAMMRINHAGEICAQALYHGQSAASRCEKVALHFQQAALEEGDHLNWCHQRLTELDSHTSYLNPVWYTGSFLIGLTAGFVGDKWSLGFVAETERQVIKHLQGHLASLPPHDGRSQRILKQMESDEAHHRDDAIKAGAKELPSPIRKLMSLTSKLMVKTSYWI